MCIRDRAHTYASNGNYTVILTTIDANGCVATATQNIVVSGCGNAPCQASFFAFPDSFNACTYNFTSTSTGSSLSYSWSFGNGNSSILANPSNTYASNGTYTVSLVISNGSGCFDTTSQTLTVTACGQGNCSASISAFPDTTNPCTYFFGSTTTGTAPFSYRWNFGSGTGSIQPNPSHTYPSNGTYTATLTVIDANGCLATTTQTVVVSGCGSAPCQASFFAFPDTTNPCTYFFSNNSTPAGGLSYSWDFGDGNTSANGNPTHIYANNGNYQVTLIVSNSSGCVDSINRTVSVLGCNTVSTCQANFIATPSMSNPCTYQFRDLSSASASIVNRQWDFGDGGTSNLPVPTHTYTSSGSFTASLIITTQTGCRDTAFQTIVVTACGPNCRANFSAVVNMTDPCTYVFTDRSTSSTLIASRQWDFGDGNTSSQTVATHTYAGDGNYRVRLIIADTSGCIDTAFQTLIVTGCSGSCQANFSFMVDMTDSCTVQFTDLATSNGVIVSRSWDFGDGNTSFLPNVSHTYTSNGNYSVSFIIIDNNACVDTVTQVVAVTGCSQPLCLARFATRQDTGNNRLIHFTDLSTGNPTAWLWDFGDGASSTSQNPSHTYQTFGTYVVNLSIVNSTTNCGSSTQDTIVVDNRVSIDGDWVKQVQFYPNPVADQLFLSVELEKAHEINWEIVDMMGRKLLLGNSAKALVHEAKMDVGRLSSGYYVFTIKQAREQIYVKRFIKK